MGKIVRLTENDLVRLVKKVISEQRLDSALRNAGFRRSQANGNQEAVHIEDLVKKYKLVNPKVYRYGNESSVLTSDSNINFFLYARAGWTGAELGPFDDKTFLSKLPYSHVRVRRVTNI